MYVLFKSARPMMARQSAHRSARRGQPGGRCIAVDLQPCNAQTSDAMGLDRALPGSEFLGRQHVMAAGVLNVHLAVAHGVDNRRFSPGDPAFCVGGRQFGGNGAAVRQEFASEISM